MATLKFIYRSSNPTSFLYARLLFRVKNDDFENGHMDFTISASSKIKVSKEYWENHHDKPLSRDAVIQKMQTDKHGELKKLEDFVIEHFETVDPLTINSKWLKRIIHLYHNPPKKHIEIPKDLTSFIDYYLERKRRDISEIRKKRIKVVKHKLERYERQEGTVVFIEDVNENFKNSYTDYCDDCQYSHNTQQTELAIIKTVCLYAGYLGLKTSTQLEKLGLKQKAVNHIYFNPKEIEIIKNTELRGERLNNARDWLLISCYTGQRISDMMRFTPDMIRVIKDKKTKRVKTFIGFKQKKTGEDMSIPLLEDCQEILEKRSGNFPRPISHQKYNDYIKEVCQLAGFTELTKGKILKCIAPEGVKPTRNDYRKVEGEFEKWELVTSHIGRRSYASNYYGKVPTAHLMRFTGHKSERMLQNYLQLTDEDLANDAYDYFFDVKK